MGTAEFTWEQQQSTPATTTFSVDDIKSLAQLMAELKELTQSRGTYAAASDFLKRFGMNNGDDTLVRPERLAN
ncbi:MAG: hypothetical protein ACK5JT_21440 [Hyphomicrobiaceae bacterium]